MAPISTDHHDDPVVADPDGRLTALEHDVARYRISRDTWSAFTFAFASIAAFAGIVAVGVAVARDPAQPATPSGETVQAHLTELVVSDKARSPSPMSCHSERYPLARHRRPQLPGRCGPDHAGVDPAR